MEPQGAPPQRSGRLPGWAAGLVATALGLGVGELVAGVIGAGGPVTVVGDRVVDGAPRAVKEWAIDWFGTNDKAVLVGGTLAVLALLAVVAGRLASTRREAALGVVAGALLLGIGSAISGRSPSWRDVLPMLVAAAVVLGAMRWLTAANSSGPVDDAPPAASAFDRRQAIVLTGGGALAAGAATLVGRRLQSDPAAAARRRSTVLPPASGTGDRAKDLADRSAVEHPFLTPNRSFYRIDTAITVPRVDARDWSLRIEGMVDRPITLTYDDLLARPQIEHMATMLCVSNPVGGGLIGNARWQGVRLADLLREAGVQEGADQLMGESVDGFTAGFPVAQALDGREALVAVGMNGEPLPFRHGYPARLVVPGLYGYVSATKWLSKIRLTTFAREQGYWIPRGWDAQPYLETGSRIDVPRSKADVAAGEVVVAGIAWAQQRGIGAVEVRVDDGPWQEATLDDLGTNDTWRQWRTTVRMSRGTHHVQVRATDGDGALQTEDRRDPGPGAATGWHTVKVKAR